MSDPLATGLLLIALLTATYLYARLLQRRHHDTRVLDRSLHSITDNYGRAGLP